MIYSEKYTPRPSDYNRNKKISYEGILQILEAVADNHSSMVGDSIAKANTIVWILTEWNVKILHRPQNGESLHIKTWVRGKAPASVVFRDFIVEDEQGATVIQAEAKFALFDLAASKLVRINEELLASYLPEEQKVFEDSSRLRAPSEYTEEQELPLRRSDIDFNGHVHNTRYLDFALQVLPPEVFAADDMTEIQIVYAKPVMESDLVCTKYIQKEAEHFISITANGTLCNTIKMKMGEQK